MLINNDHLGTVTEKNIHIIRWPNSSGSVETAVRETARSLGYRLVELRGEQLSTEHEVLLELGTKFGLFRAGFRNEDIDWNSASHILEHSGALAAPGVVVAVYNPERLLKTNPIQFTFLVDALGCQSRYTAELRWPFHVVIGPMPEDYRYEVFMNSMLVSRYFCEACQMVDE